MHNLLSAIMRIIAKKLVKMAHVTEMNMRICTEIKGSKQVKNLKDRKKWESTCSGTLKLPKSEGFGPRGFTESPPVGRRDECSMLLIVHIHRFNAVALNGTFPDCPTLD